MKKLLFVILLLAVLLSACGGSPARITTPVPAPTDNTDWRVGEQVDLVGSVQRRHGDTVIVQTVDGNYEVSIDNELSLDSTNPDDVVPGKDVAAWGIATGPRRMNATKVVITHEADQHVIVQGSIVIAEGDKMSIDHDGTGCTFRMDAVTVKPDTLSVGQMVVVTLRPDPLYDGNLATSITPVR